MPSTGRVVTVGLALGFGLIAAFGLLIVGVILSFTIGYGGLQAVLAWAGLALVIVLGIVGLLRWRDADLRNG